MTDAKAAAPKARRTTVERLQALGRVVKALGRPRVALMLALGFSSGLPFLLTAATLGYWLRDEGTSLKAIGVISWVGLGYSVEFL